MDLRDAGAELMLVLGKPAAWGDVATLVAAAWAAAGPEAAATLMMKDAAAAGMVIA